MKKPAVSFLIDDNSFAAQLSRASTLDHLGAIDLHSGNITEKTLRRRKRAFKARRGYIVSAMNAAAEKKAMAAAKRKATRKPTVPKKKSAPAK